MRIYLWSALRIMDLRMRDLRKRGLIADLHCLLTCQGNGGQVLVWGNRYGVPRPDLARFGATSVPRFPVSNFGEETSRG
jgi:hypothetical protein